MNLQEFKHCLDTFDLHQQTQLKNVISQYHNIIILGNGGSSAIASHLAEDYTKALNKRAMSFGDTATLSCFANDYGWDMAYKMYLHHYALAGSLVILISSSGKSANILNAAEHAKTLNFDMITMSGFEPDNTLRTIYSPASLMHFYIPSKDYGIVESLHSLILHSVI